MNQTWNAFQLVMSNGAYGGRDVRFMTPTDGLVEGQLRRANHSSEKPGHTLLLIDVNGDSDWYAVPNTTLVEVMA